MNFLSSEKNLLELLKDIRRDKKNHEILEDDLFNALGIPNCLYNQLQFHLYAKKIISFCELREKLARNLSFLAHMNLMMGTKNRIASILGEKIDLITNLKEIEDAVKNPELSLAS